MKRFQRTTVKVFLLLFALAIALLGLEGLLGETPAALAGPNPITACGTITTNSTLAADIVASTSPCIVFGADDIALFMDDHTINMQSQGPDAVAIETAGHTNVRVEGPGTVLTDKECPPCSTLFPDGGFGSINVTGGSNVRIRDVSVRNVSSVSGAPLPFPIRAGTGILLHETPGANLLDNLVDSYARGVWVLNSSNVPGGGASLIAHNTITNNSSAETCFGLLLDGTSDWVVDHNTASGNGLFTPFEAGITMATIFGTSGSNGNQVVGNAADMNVGSGIDIESGSTGNKIVKNHATGNNATLGDLADDNSATFTPPGVNTWMFNNVCNTERGDIPPGVCPITLP